jgi:asparagine synthase (glutamine-hydrolysing)
MATNEFYIKSGNLVSESEWIKIIESLRTGEVIEDRQKARFIVKEAVIEAVRKRIPDERFGILFSGGVDSSLIALICKQLNADFTCYTVGLENASDVEQSKKVAEFLGFKLKTRILSMEEAEEIIKKAVEIVGSNVVKVGVASVVIAAKEIADEKIFFSGLGSEEIFAGYERHLKAVDVNEECWNGLNLMRERDLTRDVAVAKAMNFELQTPFLDKELIKLAMQVPAKFKINNDNKLILREIAEEIGLGDFAWRKKKAAQYGSKFDKAIEKLAKKEKLSKSEYLNKLL